MNARTTKTRNLRIIAAALVVVGILASAWLGTVNFVSVACYFVAVTLWHNTMKWTAMVVAIIMTAGTATASPGELAGGAIHLRKAPANATMLVVKIPLGAGTYTARFPLN